MKKAEINNNKTYRVKFYGNEVKDYGIITGKEVKEIIKNCSYDNELGMWFTEKATKAYTVEEA